MLLKSFNVMVFKESFRGKFVLHVTEKFFNYFTLMFSFPLVFSPTNN